MSRMRFLFNFIKNPVQVGSVTPSSRWLCSRLLKAADLSNSECVVEFGPGTACLTKEILAILPPGARLFAFEIDKDFVEILERDLKHPALIVVNDSAEKIEEYLKAHGFDGADYIFSGLPFTVMPAPLRDSIIHSANRALKPGGKFIAYQYSRYLTRKLRNTFDNVQVGFEVRNIPPAFCFVCSKRR